MMELQKLKTKIQQEQGRLNQLKSDRDSATIKLSELQEKQLDIEEAKTIIQKVGQQTQSQLEYFISDIVSSALEAVFDDPYKFKVEFVIRRGKTECDLWFERDGELIKPLDEAGGGAVDIASFALRLSLWTLNKTRPVIIVDEPFRFLSVDLRPKASMMLKEISRKLGLQIIMVSHSEELIEEADKVFKVTKVKNISKVEEV